MWPLLAATGVVQAQAPIQVDGEVTLRAENYGNDGDPAAAVYSDTGGQYSAELDLSLRQRKSLFESWEADLGLLANDSAYRSSSQGGQLERLRIQWTKGDGQIPFRLQAGDYLAYTSQRTLQRSLRGFSLELQPASSDAERRLSLLAFAGASDTDYKRFNASNRFLGFSALSGDAKTETSWIGNLVFNHQEADTSVAAGRAQYVASLGLERRFELGDQRLTLEAELAHFSGDYDNGTTLVSDRHDQGYYLKLTGKHRSDREAPRYSLSLENYGQDYQPKGATVSADRESIELRLSQPIGEQLTLAGRAQRFKTAAQSANPSVNEVFGINLSGSSQVAGHVLSTQVDAFVSNNRNRSRSTDSQSQNLRLSLSTPLGKRSSARLNLNLSDTDNRAASSGSISRDINLGYSTQTRWSGWELGLTPSIGLIRIDASSGDSEQPSVGIQLVANKGAHQFQLDARNQLQDAHLANATDVLTRNLALRYRHQQGTRTIGLDYDSQFRNPDPGLAADGYRIGLFFQQSFEHSIDTPNKADTNSTAALTGTPLGPFPIALGQSLPTSLAQLREAGYPQAIPLGIDWQFDYALFPDLDANQRVLLQAPQQRVERIGLVLRTLPGQGIAELEELLGDTLDAVSRELGPPDDSLERGDFSLALADALRNGEFARIYQWKLGEQSLRLGIPPRLDGRLRIELIQSVGSGRLKARDSWGLAVE